MEYVQGRVLPLLSTPAVRAQVEWPTSVVVSQGAQAQYQVLFRHLFELELASRSLHATWRAYQATRALFRCAASRGLATERRGRVCLRCVSCYGTCSCRSRPRARCTPPGAHQAHARALSVGVVPGLRASA